MRFMASRICVIWVGWARKLPVTYAMMFIGSLALVGIWPFAGHYSKDIILEAALADHSWFGLFAYRAGVLTALMTGFLYLADAVFNFPWNAERPVTIL